MYDDDGNHHTWGLHEENMLQGGTWNTLKGALKSVAGATKGIVTPDADYDLEYGYNDPSDVACGMWSQDPCGDIDSCVLKAATAYPKITQYKNFPPFTNSNTFAGAVASKCNLVKPNVPPASTPGWGNPQPAGLR